MDVAAGAIETPEAEATEFDYHPPEYNLAMLSIDRINVCAQHRNGSSPVQRELDASIAEHAMDSPLLITILDRARMEEYIEFTNGVWENDVSIDDFVPNDESGETFVLLVAGHSRLRACQAHAEQLGCRPERYPTYARIKDLPTIDEIVACQTRENIHAAPPPQNTARLLAESWFLLKQQEAAGGERVSKRDFAKRHRVGEKAFRNALHYVELPSEIRELTDEGSLPYHVAVEIGRSSAVLAEWAETVDPESAADLHRTELLRLATCYLRSEKILMSVQEIRARVDGYRETIGNDEEAEQQPLEDFMTLLKEPSRAEQARKQLEAELKEVQGRMQRGHLSLQNRIAELAGIEGAGIREAHMAEIVGEATELLEGETAYVEQA